MLKTMPVRRMTDPVVRCANMNEPLVFEPTRAAGLKRLEQFLPRAGHSYASQRNYDFGPARRSNVSSLSPWLRHRILTEEEVLRRVLEDQGPNAADKFIQEVFWRTYFKGWLEQHPSVWTHYNQDLRAACAELESDHHMAASYRDAVSGKTGIDCFDHWIAELTTTGYLHNHARMWVTSIWIFTLRLPWQLGADFFLRHLLDGDPASNTLSWRWVAGLHTKGKTYLARPENIAKFTQDRFHPKGLATVAEPLEDGVDHPRVPLPEPQAQVRDPYLLLLTEDDLGGAALMPLPPAGAVGLLATDGRSPAPVGGLVTRFAKGAMDAALMPFETEAVASGDWADDLIRAADRVGVRSIATAYVPLGPARRRLDAAEAKLHAAGLSLHRMLRPYDQIVWPYAKAGFFGLKKKIPQILAELRLPT